MAEENTELVLVSGLEVDSVKVVVTVRVTAESEVLLLALIAEVEVDVTNGDAVTLLDTLFVCRC